jgi:hypothetical protein
MIWFCLGAWIYGSICFVAGAWWAGRSENAVASERQALRSLARAQETLLKDDVGSHRSSDSGPQPSQGADKTLTCRRCVSRSRMASRQARL